MSMANSARGATLLEGGPAKQNADILHGKYDAYIVILEDILPGAEIFLNYVIYRR